MPARHFVGCDLASSAASIPDMRQRLNQPTASLLADTLALSRRDPASVERWNHIYELHRRGEENIFQAAKAWCGSDDPSARKLAADILAQLGPLTQEGEEQLRPFTKRSSPLMQVLLDDSDVNVIIAAISFFRHHYRSDPIVERPALSSHPDAEVRLAVAQCLGFEKALSATSRAVVLLIRLSEDHDERVRDWATFGLGYLSHSDTGAVRDALFRRLNDDHLDTREEALIGLAERRDERVIPFVTVALQENIVGRIAVEAAAILALPIFMEPLEKLRSWWDVDPKLLEDALDCCRMQRPLYPSRIRAKDLL